MNEMVESGFLSIYGIATAECINDLGLTVVKEAK